jgi:hypothetical protein
MTKTTAHNLEIRQLDVPYAAASALDIENALPLLSFGSSTPWGSISVGDSITDASTRELLGVVSHVNHEVGEYDSGNMQITRVFLNPKV